MLDKNLFEKIWPGIVRFSRRIAEGVAHLSNWQFVLLGFLALIGAGILQDILESPPSKRRDSHVEITVNRDAPQPTDRATLPGFSKPPQAPADPLENAIRKKVLIEIKKGVAEESSTAEMAKSIKQEVLKRYRRRSTPKLMQPKRLPKTHSNPRNQQDR